MTKRILVVGATGLQSGAVVDALLSGVYGDFGVYAMTSDVKSDDAVDLRRLGARIVPGDLDRPGSYRPYFEQVDGAFLVTDSTDADYDREVRRGYDFVDAAARAGLDHLVFASAMGADFYADVDMLDAKLAIERRIRDRGVPATVVRPGVFVQHFEAERAAVRDGELAWPVSPTTLLPLVDAHDVGAVAAMAFAHPERFVGEDVDLAGDLLTLPEMAEAFSATIQREVDPVHLSREEAGERFGEQTVAYLHWIDGMGGLKFDATHLAELDIQPRSLREALDAGDWKPTPALP
ncbi:NmrA/HSCARG family protein [Haloarchaeobius amylolyticus]|uniref:NmrA/HSCARG family protein n=1 Tax=Haloarchaeobius amylolyticus TaxID=1198296 RepID=UPI00226F98D5|nr:NmrA/HSCARG family protein [Haloarchaeobius amylolyticus]